jgi:hypothetical protein
MLGPGKGDLVHAKQIKVEKVMMVGNIKLRKAGAEHRYLFVLCLQDIKNYQLHRVIEKGHIQKA